MRHGNEHRVTPLSERPMFKPTPLTCACPCHGYSGLGGIVHVVACCCIHRIVVDCPDC